MFGKEADGQIITSQQEQKQLYRVDPVTGNRTAISGLGIGTGPEFHNPWGLAKRNLSFKLAHVSSR